MKKSILFLLCLLPLIAQAQWQKRIPPGGAPTDLVQLKGRFFTLLGATLYASDDYGQSWHPSTLTKPGYTLEQLRTDADTLYVAGAAGLTEGIFRSTDLGETWQELPSPYIWLYGHRLEVANHGTLYFREYFTLYELKPGATQWETLYTFANVDYPFYAVGGDYIFIATSHNLRRYHRLTHQLVPISNAPISEVFFWGGHLVAFGGPDVLWSDDFGDTWTTANSIPHLFQLIEADGRLYGVSNSQILQSDNLLDWSPLFATSNVYPKQVAIAGKVMLALSDSGRMMRSVDLGEHWITNNSGLPNSIDSPWFAKNHMPSYLQLGVDLSPDGGRNWSAPLVNGGLTGNYVEDHGKILTVGYQNGSYVILQSDLAMQDWQWLSNMPTPISGDHFAKVGSKLVFNSDKILVSSDGGSSWVEEGALPSFGDLEYSHKENLIVAGVNGGLSLSPDFGHTWQDIAPAGINPYKVVSTGDTLFAWHD
ncbi:MAG: hypothetical protein ABIQ93_16645, partial [Saprospiraceae bacterium]